MSKKNFQIEVSSVKIEAANSTLYFGRKEISKCTFHIHCTNKMKYGITDLHKIFALFLIFIARFG
jgi:hypothetical protein